MDRSFLSDDQVVAASRSFVCIRLATYEDQKEADFLTSIYVGRSGQMENTTFAILSPDGKSKLTKAGRAPFHAFRGAGGMATGMSAITAQYPAAKTPFRAKRLPLMKNLDLALNVAAADGLPLIISVGDKQQRDRLNEKLNTSAWDESLAGQFIYATAEPKELKPITGAKRTMGIYVVHPGQFGLSGQVVATLNGDEPDAKLKATLTNAVAKFPRRAKNHNAHVRLGIQLGVDWESEIPVTDQQSIRARERARGR